MAAPREACYLCKIRMHRFRLIQPLVPRIAAILAVACLWACAVDLGIEKKDGGEDPSGEDPLEEEAGDPVDVPGEPDAVLDVPDEPDAPLDPVDDPDAVSDPACGGLEKWDVCWYLGEGGESCNATCDSRGGVSDRAPLHVGSTSQGGSREQCEELLSALGHEGTVAVGAALPDRGFGCHVWSGETLYWVEDVDLDPTDSHPHAQVVCGCVE